MASGETEAQKLIHITDFENPEILILESAQESTDS